jgi:hypothetical protein
MVQLQEKKANLIASTVNKDKSSMEKLTPEDLQFLFRGTWLYKHITLIELKYQVLGMFRMYRFTEIMISHIDIYVTDLSLELNQMKMRSSCLDIAASTNSASLSAIIDFGKHTLCFTIYEQTFLIHVTDLKCICYFFHNPRIAIDNAYARTQ